MTEFGPCHRVVEPGDGQEKIMVWKCTAERLCPHCVRIAELSAGLVDAWAGIDDLVEKVTGLEAKLAEAQEDSERLDWIEAEGYAELYQGSLPNGLDVWCCCGKAAKIGNNSVRAAIDAARQEEEK